MTITSFLVAFRRRRSQVSWSRALRIRRFRPYNVAVSGEVTQVLEAMAASTDDPTEASARLLHLVYPELRALAQSYFGGQRSDHTLQATALVHEAFIKLVESPTAADREWSGRGHFFAVAAKAMRQILSNHARDRQAQKRGGGAPILSIQTDQTPHYEAPIDLIDLDDALDELETLDPRQARIVEMRFFAGMSVAETARLLQVSERTVTLDWRMASTWLRQRLDADPESGP